MGLAAIAHFQHLRQFPGSRSIFTEKTGLVRGKLEERVVHAWGGKFSP
ncbi:hypothetical protein [Microseira sp. BLCC-F43]|jgi:hypothetical protein